MGFSLCRSADQNVHGQIGQTFGRLWVVQLDPDLDDARIVRSTIELAHNLGLTVVAEGLETAKAWAMLSRLGCDEGQGYFICKPMPQEQFGGCV